MKLTRQSMILALAAAGALTLAGCVTDPVSGQPIYGNTAKGALIGALGGAAAGTLAGGNDGRNAAIGAAVGALAGAGVGRYMDQQEADMRKRTAGTEIGVKRVGDQLELTMPADVTFARNESSIQSAFYPALNQVATSLTQFPSTKVDVIGHADSDGADDYNQALSERRANSVKDYLIGRGVQPVRLVAYGRGETQPIVPNTTPENKAKNRRVQILLTPVTN